MLRVSPDGQVLWVQTAGANSNVVLDVENMEEVHTEPAGKGPVQSAFGPTAGRFGLLTHLEESFVLVLERESGRTAQRIDVGGAQANASFTPDGVTAFVTVPSKNEVVAIDMAELAIVGRIPAGGEPMGIVLLEPGG